MSDGKTKQELLTLAIEVATKAHEGQLDKGGRPYILHPQTVAASLDETEHKIIAYLHDVCEDTDLTIEDLRALGFPKTITDAIDILTRRDETPYEDYIRFVKKNKSARCVKLADLRHNMDITRIPNPSPKDYKRVEKYKRAYNFLMED